MIPANHRLVPKLIEILRGYTRGDLVSDVVAGVTIGLVALPLAMAFGIASGVTREAGIINSIVAGIVVAAFGGSRCQVSGPTGAFVVIIAGIVAKFGIPGLLMCTLMAGVMLVLMGLTGLGAAVRYIPHPVTIGFTNGIAVLIASTQIRDFLGLELAHVPGDSLGRINALFRHVSTVNPWSIAVSPSSLAVVLLWPKVTRRLPATIVALIVATAIVGGLGVDVETIGSRFGGIHSGLPDMQIPELRPDLILALIPSAVTVALLAAIESLLSAVIADNLSGDRHKPDIELVAQGVANIRVPMFGGLPATGVIARTVTNIRSAARSPIASILLGFTLLGILLFAAPLAWYVPLATLAAILFVLAYNMGEWREISIILGSSWPDRLVWLATFALTVLADLTVAVEVGMVLAAFLYIYRFSETTSVELVTHDYIIEGRPHVLHDKSIPPFVTILRIHGPFLFGATTKLEAIGWDLFRFHPIVILRLRNLTALNGTGLHALEDFAKRVKVSGRYLIVCGARRQPARLIGSSMLPQIIGRENICPHIAAALHQAQAIYGSFNGVVPEMARGLSHQTI